MTNRSAQVPALRYDQKARLALAACVLLAALTITGLVRWTAELVIQVQTEFNLARAAIATGDAAERRPPIEVGRAEQLLPGRSLADVQGAAQAQLRALTERRGAGIASLQVTATDGRGSLTPVRLRAALVVPEPDLAAFLTDLAISKPLLALETIEAQPEGIARGDHTSRPMLSVRVEAVGFARLGPRP